MTIQTSQHPRVHVTVKMFRSRTECDLAGYEFYHEIIYTVPAVAPRIFTASRLMNSRYIVYSDEFL